LKELRETYYRSFPEQRLNIALQRIRNPEHSPNLLVTYVSAIEGLLRFLVIWAETNDGRPSAETYETYKNRGVSNLYLKYLALKNCGEIVSSQTFELIGYAVEYRNLLAHECAYLGQDKYPELIAACQQFLEALSNHAGLKNS
jgi:hypothetical protein